MSNYNIYNAQTELVTQEQGGRKADQLLSMYTRGLISQAEWCNAARLLEFGY